jgi:hypothetical protein
VLPHWRTTGAYRADPAPHGLRERSPRRSRGSARPSGSRARRVGRGGRGSGGGKRLADARAGRRPRASGGCTGPRRLPMRLRALWLGAWWWGTGRHERRVDAGGGIRGDGGRGLCRRSARLALHARRCTNGDLAGLAVRAPGRSLRGRRAAGRGAVPCTLMEVRRATPSDPRPAHPRLEPASTA